jgi:hypothetical protein
VLPTSTVIELQLSPTSEMTSHGDRYKEEVDFAALALEFPGFKKQYDVRLCLLSTEISDDGFSLKTNGQLDFGDPEAVR